MLSGELCTPSEITLIICGVWSFWSGRNARRHGKDRWNAQAAVRHVSAMVEDLKCLQMSNSPRPPRQERRGQWESPPQGWLKVNSDAAFNANSSAGAPGVVIRDADGRLLPAAAKHYPILADALTGELLAARDGLALASQRGLDKVILESDNLTMVNMLRDGIGNRSVFYGLWQEIQELSRSFVFFKLFVCLQGRQWCSTCMCKFGNIAGT